MTMMTARKRRHKMNSKNQRPNQRLRRPTTCAVLMRRGNRGIILLRVVATLVTMCVMVQTIHCKRVVVIRMRMVIIAR